MIEERCELLARNCSMITKKFSSEDHLMCVAAGLIYTLADREADSEKLAECKALLKKNAGFFSSLRSTIELALISKMALSPDPERYLNDVKSVYEKVRSAKFKDSSHTVLACLSICDLGLQAQCDEIIDKAKEIMKRMEKDHPFLTAAEDSPFVMLLALSYKDVDTILKDLEEGYDYLRKMYHLGVSMNGVQNLCEVLVITYGDMKAKCDRIARIYEAFKDRKSGFGGDSEFSTLGILAGIDADPDTLADEIIKAADCLKEKDGFGDKQTDRTQRLMYAATLVAGAYGKDNDVIDDPAISNTLSIISAKRTVNTINILINISANVLPALLEAAAGTEKDGDKSEQADGDTNEATGVKPDTDAKTGGNTQAE